MLPVRFSTSKFDKQNTFQVEEHLSHRVSASNCTEMAHSSLVWIPSSDSEIGSSSADNGPGLICENQEGTRFGISWQVAFDGLLAIDNFVPRGMPSKVREKIINTDSNFSSDHYQILRKHFMNFIFTNEKVLSVTSVLEISSKKIDACIALQSLKM